MNKLLSKDASADFLKIIKETGMPYAYDYAKHKITISDKSGNETIGFRLPLTLSPGITNHNDDPLNYIILLVQSGNCAVGYYENGKNIDHKVFRSYMIRKKQGKSQVKYLKTRGKSKAGSRVRLGETIDFFENINERLNEYFEDFEIDRIAVSCSKILVPYLFNSKVKTPFDKRDPRIFKIPRHIHTPIFEVMTDTNKFLLKGELIYEDVQQPIVNDLLKDLFRTVEEDDSDEY
jgi:hypothetical protein